MSELIVVQQENAIQIFTNMDLVDKLVEEVEGKITESVPDVHSAQGRQEIASLANKVARTKTSLDSIGKGLTDDWRQKTNAVNACRKSLRDRLDMLKKKARLPLTEWEAEQARIAEEKRLLESINADHEEAHRDNRLFDLEKQEEQRLRQVKERQDEIQRKKDEQETARQREIRENAIRREAEEKAKLAIIREKELAEKRIKEAQEAAKRAEQAAIEEKNRAVREAEARERKAAEKRERERLAKIEKERITVEKKARNKAHISAVKKAAYSALAERIPPEFAKTALSAINAGEIPAVKIIY